VLPLFPSWLQLHRTIPSSVAFRAKPGFNVSSTKPLTEDDCEFLTTDYGEKAIRASEIRPNMTGGYFASLVGLTPSALKQKASNFLIPSTPGHLHINDAAIVSLLGYIESVTNGKTIDNLALIFPAYYTLYERLIWTEGLQTIGLTNISEFDDAQAVTFNYIVTKSIDKPRNVLFIDIGATSIKSYAIQFTLDSQKIPTATRLSY
jgi:molecular chaperone DnaK (HSP70)